MKRIIRTSLILFAIFSFSGCGIDPQKQELEPVVEPEPQAPAAARLVRVITEYVSGGHNVSDISFDSKGRMTKLTGGMLLGADGVCNIEYNDASKTATAKYGDESMVIDLDASGHCVNDGFWRYTYFGGHLVSCQAIDGSATYSYTWENDCLTDIGYNTKASGKITYDTHDNPFYGQSYDPFCTIDPSNFTEAMSLGFCAVSSKKLYKNYYGAEFSYSFSKDGRLNEVMMSYDGIPKAVFYLSYNDETIRQPRDEKPEALPSFLKGDWVATGRVEGGSEIPGFDIFGLSCQGINIEHGLEIYRIKDGSMQTLPIEVDEKGVKYSGGVLSGVRGEPYDIDTEKNDLVYKSGCLHIVENNGEWRDGLSITKIDDNKFYSKGLGGDSSLYVYERVTELSEEIEEPVVEIQPGSIFISNDAKEGICSLIILEQGLIIDDNTGELSGTGKTAYFFLSSDGGGDDEMAAGTYLSSESTIKAESTIYMTPEEFNTMSGHSITDAVLTVSRETKGDEIYYSGNFEFFADGVKYDGYFDRLTNSVMSRELETPVPDPIMSSSKSQL